MPLSEWFFNHFLLYAPATRLLLHGYSSHYCPEVIRAALEQEIIIFTLLPNTIHITQPGFFAPLRKKVCHEYLVKNPGKCITCYEFSELLYDN